MHTLHATPDDADATKIETGRIHSQKEGSSTTKNQYRGINFKSRILALISYGVIFHRRR